MAWLGDLFPMRWFVRQACVWSCGWLVRAVVGAVVMGGVARGEGGGVTDEQVVKAMKKGVDFLLANKKGADNWETGQWKQSWDDEKGGETSLVVYALLHAGDSMQDSTEYHTKLHWRSKEMFPAVQWLEKNMVGATYVAGLEASALTLLPKIPGQKPEEGPGKALESIKFYLLTEMGETGGYTYPKERLTNEFGELWKAWYQNKDAAAKAKMDKFVTGSQSYAPLVVIQKLAQEIRENGKNNQAATEAELKALEDYARKMPQRETVDQQIKAQKKVVLDLEAQKKAGKKVDDKLGSAQEKLKEMMDDKVKKFVFKGDLSNGQYGTLGAWALADYGIELPNDYWEVQERFWRMTQCDDGGWAYQFNPDRQSKGTMTCAGLASMYVCQEFTDTELRLLPVPDKAIDSGLAWLTKEFKPDTGSGYYMYGVERVGLASGLKFFGTTNWYKEGAADLVKRQAANGGWSIGYNGFVSTSYALLFLARGRNPVVFNKLQYNGPWNARPRDDAYVTRWISKQVEKPINWQIVNLQVDPSEWMDAPVLLITGSQDPKFTKEDVAKLRTFVDAGGMIFSTADGGKTEFTEAMKRYASMLVNKKYEMRVLPKNHELLDKELLYKGTGVDARGVPPLWGMSNGIRELWVHSPTDMGADWQTRKYASDASFELGRALYFYASGKASLRSKLQPLTVAAPSGAAARTVNVARLDYAGNSDPEPGAWERIAKLARASADTEVKVSLVKFGQLDPKKYPLAHLTGTNKVTFADEDVAALTGYLAGGGILFVDAAGGNADFGASARELLKRVYPSENIAALPPDHPVYMGSMPGGTKLEQVDFRKYGMFKLHRRIDTPALEQIAVNGKTRVIFSSWDVCSGFLGTNTWGIMGYAPATSEILGRNILVYAAKGEQVEAKGNAE